MKVLWMACNCYIWPVLPGGQGACKRCGSPADRRVLRPPVDGKAKPRKGWEKL